MIIIRFLINTFVLWLVAYVVPGVDFQSTWSLIITVVIFGLINALIRPILLLLTLPINILSLGFFTLIINALMFWLASSIVKGFFVADFWSAFWGSLLYAIIMIILNNITNSKNNKPIKAKRI